MFENIIPIYFIISFAIGIFFTYILTGKPTVIIKYPTPYNSGKLIYKDKAKNCYKYSYDIIKCPLNKTKIVDFIFQ